jgi:hypothetical protein
MIFNQATLFELGDNLKTGKTYRAIRHEVIRAKQAENCLTVHHPDEKIRQIKRVLQNVSGWGDLSILEMFAGHGNCTKEFAKYGEVLAYEKNKKVFGKLTESVLGEMLVTCNNADAYLEYHRLIFLRQKFDIIDLDPYGFPNRFFPDIFLLIDRGVLFVTMPKPYVNILNGITASHLVSYYGTENPKFNDIVNRIAMWGLCHWRKVVLIDCVDCKSVWRFAFQVDKVKATEYTGVKNR